MHKSKNNFVVFALPISGGNFPNQLGELCEYHEAIKIYNGGFLTGTKSYSPDLVLSSSGGNVSAYLALSGNWCTEGILRSSKMLDPKSFSQPWVTNELSLFPNIFVGLSKGSLYKQGYGAKYLFKKFFTDQTIIKTEIWSGTYNNTLKSAQFFCNKSHYDSIINETFFNDKQFLYDSLRLQFMNGDLDKISEVAIASASIPLIVPNQKIGEEEYADGGCMYPSPLSVFSDEIYRIIKNKNSIPNESKLIFDKKNNKVIKKYYHDNNQNKTFENFNDGSYEEIKNEINFEEKNLRLIYFMPYQADRINEKKSGILEEETTEAIQQILHTAMLKDRNTAISLIEKLSSSVSTSTFPEMNTEKLASLISELEKHKHYIICLNPHGSPKISLTKFKTEDIINTIHKTRNGYSVMVWYSAELIF